MDFSINNLTNRFCSETKKCVSLYILPNETPYYEIDDGENDDLKCRSDYVNLCIETSYEIWKCCDFSDNLVVIFEDKYANHHKNEEIFIESCLNKLSCKKNFFKWSDDGETYNAIRYIWKTDKINVKRLFKKIILSDICEDTEMDNSVYIVDVKNDNVFFFYDDRGIDVFTNDEILTEKLKSFMP